MKKSFVIILFVLVLVSIGVISSPLVKPVNNVIKRTDTVNEFISVEKNDNCRTEFFEEKVKEIGECIRYNNYSDCINQSGKIISCKDVTREEKYSCVKNIKTVISNKTTCVSEPKLLITMKNEDSKEKGLIGDSNSLLNNKVTKELDFSDFGPCVYEEQNGCLIITCQSKYDGANDGKFHGCKSGTSCQKFEICDGSIKSYFKNSRDDFIENDDSFFVEKLNLKEAGK